MTTSDQERANQWVSDAVDALKWADVELVTHLLGSKIGPLIDAVETDPAFSTV